MTALLEFAIEIVPHYEFCGSCLPFYGITTFRLLLFLFLDNFAGNANTYVSTKYGCTVLV